MKEEKNIYISEEASYPSLDTLNKYANGELLDDEKEQVEETIENDPFMADVLDGLSESTDLVLVKQSINRIKLNSQKRLFAVQPKKRETLSKRKSRTAPNKYTQLIIATAAAIAFLFVTVFVVKRLEFKDNGVDQIAANNESLEQVDLQEPNAQLMPTDSSNTENLNGNSELIASSDGIREEGENSMRKSLPEEVIEEKPLIATRDLEHEISEDGPLVAPKPIPNNVTESTTNNDFETTTGDDELNNDIVAEKRERELETRKEEAEARSKIITDSERKVLTAEEIAAIPVQKEHTSLIPLDERLRQNMNKELAESQNAKSGSASYQKPTDAPLMKEDDIKKGEYLKGMAMADLLTEAIRLYDDGSYNASLNNVLEVLQSQPGNLVAKYYAGGCYFSIKQYKLAIPYLKDVAKIENTDFQDDARWLLARSYVARGKEKNAISELNILITEKTKYSSDAVILMEELKR